AYLEKSSKEVERPAKKLDLFSFYNEITSLKNEIRIESRYIKQGFADIQEAIKQNEEKDFIPDEQIDNPTGGTPNELQPLLDGLLDLYDRIYASIQSMPQHNRQERKKKKGSFWSRWHKKDKKKELSDKEQEIIASMRTGQQMLLDRITGLLLAWDINPIVTLQQQFNPHTMRALGTDNLSEYADGVVSVEIRTGFQQQGKLLRLADVRVNRYSLQNTEHPSPQVDTLAKQKTKTVYLLAFIAILTCCVVFFSTGCS
ncbi:MAG: nucleotide exchange factor GrpE, partial [Candidatus Electrothrix sp. AR3]|nr:nucleotide exchange factor GrpE [Candidatus Electrothrix sp. AR3]